jgi:hypothetical protein
MRLRDRLRWLGGLPFVMRALWALRHDLLIDRRGTVAAMLLVADGARESGEAFDSVDDAVWHVRYWRPAFSPVRRSGGC